MKTVCKKLLCLMLVAMMLVSAVPAAFAAGDATIHTVVYFGTYEHSEDLTVSGSTAKAFQLVSMIDPEWADYYTFVRYDAGNGKSTNGSEDFAVTDGMTVYIRMEEKDSGSNSGSGSGNGIEAITPGGSGSGTGTGTGESTGTGTGTGTDTGTGTGSGEAQPSNPGSGEPQPGQTTGACKLTINYNLEGYAIKSVNAVKGYKYSEYVGVPARGGYDFLGWFSESYDDYIDIEKDVIREDDVIEAMWGPAKKFSLTLDQNRDDIEVVNRVVQVSYGEAIYDKVMKYVPGDRKGYVFVGWKLNGTMIDEDTIYEYPDDATAYAVWKLESDTNGEVMNGTTNTQDGKVYLEIYVNGDTSELVKRVNITDYAKDNKITRTEVETVAKKHVKAKSGYTLKFEGLFDEDSWWWYTRDPETDGADTIVVNRDGDDYVYVMVKNVKKTVADDTNPKTGDSIMIAATTMALSAAALVSMVELKKRKMI